MDTAVQLNFFLQTRSSSSIFQGNQTCISSAHKTFIRVRFKARLCISRTIPLKRSQRIPVITSLENTVNLPQSYRTRSSSGILPWIGSSGFLSRPSREASRHHLDSRSSLKSLPMKIWLMMVASRALQTVTRVSVHGLIICPITFLCCN